VPNAKGSVGGPNHAHQIVFYGLSTCIWCRRTREWLESAGLQFDYFYVDLLSGAEREAVLAEVRRWNPAVSFPTLVIDGARSVVGYRVDELKAALGI
jgi:glutaredoxin-like protein NrdH